MKQTIAAAGAAAICMTGAATASAADPATGFYIGAGIGATRFEQDFGAAVRGAYEGTTFTVTSASMTDDSGTTGLAYAGWQFHPNFAVEAAYADLGKAKASYALERQGPFTRDAEYKLSAVTLGLVGSVPVGANVSLFAKGGVAWTKLEYRESGDDRGEPFSFTASDLDQLRAMAALGASYAATPNLSIRAEWDRYFDVGNTFALTAEGNGNFDSIDAIWIGLQYRF
jgi:opacity protein-like surface antigen